MSISIDRLATLVATRRGSLALGTASLLGLTQLGSAHARKKGKNKNKKKKSCKQEAQQKVDAACGPQADACLALFSSSCDTSSDRQRCLADIAECCALFAECQFTEAWLCLTSTPLD